MACIRIGRARLQSSLNQPIAIGPGSVVEERLCTKTGVNTIARHQIITERLGNTKLLASRSRM